MLKDFYINESMRNEVKGYITDFIKVETLRKVFEREDVSGVAEARELIDKAFDNLEIMFSSTPEQKEIKNEAR